MQFGGYVAYTVDGFKCRAFGTDEIKKAIVSASSELDIPTLLGLKPERKGFRRTALKSPAGQIVIYSAFIGLSEPNATRQGSFLAIGITGGPELDCATIGLGHRLSDLLDDLVRRVSDGNRFTSDMSDDTLNVFLREKSSVLKEVHEKLALSAHPFGAKSGPGIIFLSEEAIWGTSVFNQICERLSGEVDFFLFEATARPEVQNAHHYFRIGTWPVRKGQDESPSPTQGVKQAQRQVPPQNVGAQEGAGEMSASELKQTLKRMTEDDRRVEDRLGSIEDFLVFWRPWLVVAAGGLFALFVLLVILTYQWGSANDGQINSIERRLKSLESSLANRQPSTPPPAPTPEKDSTLQDQDSGSGEDAPKPRSIRIAEPMGFEPIRSRYCRNYGKSEFEREFMRLNKNDAKTVDATVPSGTIMLFPGDCTADARR